MRTISEAELNRLQLQPGVKVKRHKPKKPKAVPNTPPQQKNNSQDKTSSQLAEAITALKMMSANQLSQMSQLIEMIADRPDPVPSGIKRMNVIRNKDGLIDHVEFE